MGLSPAAFWSGFLIGLIFYNSTMHKVLPLSLPCTNISTFIYALQDINIMHASPLPQTIKHASCKNERTHSFFWGFPRAFMQKPADLVRLRPPSTRETSIKYKSPPTLKLRWAKAGWKGQISNFFVTDLLELNRFIIGWFVLKGANALQSVAKW